MLPPRVSANLESYESVHVWPKEFLLVRSGTCERFQYIFRIAITTCFKEVINDNGASRNYSAKISWIFVTMCHEHCWSFIFTWPKFSKTPLDYVYPIYARTNWSHSFIYAEKFSRENTLIFQNIKKNIDFGSFAYSNVLNSQGVCMCVWES